MRRLLATCAVLTTLGCLTASAAAPPQPPRPVSPLTLKAIDGTTWTVPVRNRPTVLVYLSCECPMSNAYIEKLNDLTAEHRGRVVFVAINANREESATEVKAHAREYRLAFAVLKDDAQVSVKALAARVYPEVFLFDAQGVLRYRGRIDDGYSARLKPRSRPGRQDLRLAIEEVLAGKPVRVPETLAHGCPIPGTTRKPQPAATVTYHRDVLPILQQKCQSCHRPGQVGPFALLSYRQAVKWAEDIVGETKARRMPPWKATQRGVFTNERSLSAAEIRTLANWLEQGMPEGDARQAPKPVTFPDGWKLGKPDLVLTPTADMVVGATGRDLFRVFVLPTGLKEDRHIAAVEVQPGNPRVVHHTLQMIDVRGRGRALEKQANARADSADHGPGYSTRMGFGFLPDPARGLGGWAPGLVPQLLPEGVGQKLPAGADLLLQVHYHRTGKEERDRTRIGLYFQKGVVKDHFFAIPVPGLFLRIPAGDRAFQVRSAIRLSEDLTLYYLVPHMHLLGRKIELTAQPPGGKEEALITIDAWDYNWQEMYQLRTPRLLPRGTILRVKAEYDNSRDNPLNPYDPPRTIRFGEQTTNEMCFVFCGVSARTPGFLKFSLAPFGG